MTMPTVTLRDTNQQVDVATYLQGVVPSEMPASWPVEALKAQCVAATSYILLANVPRSYLLEQALGR
jgi:SpoIID/LytB domain protein